MRGERAIDFGDERVGQTCLAHPYHWFKRVRAGLQARSLAGRQRNRHWTIVRLPCCHRPARHVHHLAALLNVGVGSSADKAIVKEPVSVAKVLDRQAQWTVELNLNGRPDFGRPPGSMPPTM